MGKNISFQILVFFIAFVIVVKGLKLLRAITKRQMAQLFGKVPKVAEAPAVAKPSWEVESPMDILKRRYARGEIAKDEFEQMKQDIQS